MSIDETRDKSPGVLENSLIKGRRDVSASPNPHDAVNRSNIQNTSHQYNKDPIGSAKRDRHSTNQQTV